MRAHSLYALVDPRTDEIRYVGKALDPFGRLQRHLLVARNGRRTHCYDWIRSLLAQGLEPTLQVLETDVSESDINDREVAVIAELLAAGIRLTNGTAGGDGMLNPSPEVREKMAAAKRGRPCSAGALMALEKGRTSDVRRRAGATMAGRPRSKETKDKIRASLMGHPVSAEARAKMSAAKRRRSE